jgi:hypothetical protein
MSTFIDAFECAAGTSCCEHADARRYRAIVVWLIRGSPWRGKGLLLGGISVLARPQSRVITEKLAPRK